jgi:hypothetical protein
LRVRKNLRDQFSTRRQRWSPSVALYRVACYGAKTSSPAEYIMTSELGGLGKLVDRRLLVSMDMNHDGIVSIADVGLWLQWLFFMPGDLATLVLLGTPIGDFLEITSGSLQGWGSGFLSFCVWYVAFQGLLCDCKPRPAR